MATCVQCGRATSVTTTATGRALCADCARQLTQWSGAVGSLASGGSAGDAVTTGIAAGAWSGAADGEVAAMRRRREKLASTTGFWRRLWVRVIG